MNMLGATPEDDQALRTLLSVSYGGYTQIAKMASLDKIHLSDKTHSMVESAMWRIIESYQKAYAIEPNTSPSVDIPRYSSHETNER